MPDIRIDGLEARLTHHEKTIADLNEVVTAQWKKIEALERQVARLSEEVEALDSSEASPPQKPPHY